MKSTDLSASRRQASGPRRVRIILHFNANHLNFRTPSDEESEAIWAPEKIATMNFRSQTAKRNPKVKRYSNRITGDQHTGYLFLIFARK